MDEKQELLNSISNAWDNMHFVRYEARVARQFFLDLLLEGEENNITQEEMASVCASGEDHISRSRIAQYLSQARKAVRSR